MAKHAKSDLVSKFSDIILRERSSLEIVPLYIILFMAVSLGTDFLSSYAHSFIHNNMIYLAAYKGTMDGFLYNAIIANEFSQDKLQLRFVKSYDLVDSNLVQFKESYRYWVDSEAYFSNIKYISQLILLLLAIIEYFRPTKLYFRLFPWIRACIAIGVVVFVCYFLISFYDLHVHSLK